MRRRLDANAVQAELVVLVAKLVRMVRQLAGAQLTHLRAACMSWHAMAMVLGARRLRQRQQHLWLHKCERSSAADLWQRLLHSAQARLTSATPELLYTKLL